MKIEAVNSNSIRQNNRIYNKGKNTTFTAKYLYNDEERREEAYKVSRLNAVVTCMIVTGLSVLAAICWFYFTKGKPNIRGK